MATSAQPYIAGAPPTRVERVSNTTLFALAEKHYGNALYWTVIAAANGLTDPWITPLTQITIPPLFTSAAPSGILGA